MSIDESVGHVLLLDNFLPSRDIEKLTDQELAKALRTTGSLHCLAEIWHRHGRAVYSRALQILRKPGDAEDVTSETFYQAHAAILAGGFKGKALGPWLSVIARNLSVNNLKLAHNSKRAQVRDLTSIYCEQPSAEIIAVVQSVLRRLNVEQSVTLKLLYMHGLTYEEIAKEQGWGIKDVKSHAQNGRRMFEQIWNSQ